ncbi:hypothetical protein IWW36_005554, partial [Coemansia brasiliensis]
MYSGRSSYYSPSVGSGMHPDDRHGYNRFRERRSPPMGRRAGRIYGAEPPDGYHDYHRRSSPLHPRRSIDRNVYGSRSSMRHKPSVRSIPRAPSFGRRPMYGGSFVSSRVSLRSPPAMLSPRQMAGAHPAEPSEKHTLPPYDAAYSHLMDDGDDELIAMQRARRNRRILKYSGYALLCLLIVLTCSLLGYFLAPRTPVVALHAINSPESVSTSKFKLQGTKMQFHVDLIYRVQNDNFFDMSINDISTAVFWPDTKFALGGGRLSDIRVPARRTVQISMPIAMKYDVKRGPPPILLGMVESCGLHDTGIGEINLEVEVQADVHTKMKQTAIQSGRQSISIKCPVRRMATLQVDDGTSGNLGDIVRIQRMSFIDLTVDDGDHSVAENTLVMQMPITPQRLGHSSDSEVYEVSDSTPTGP